MKKEFGDDVYINTSEIGIVSDNVKIGANLVRPKYAVIVSGEIGLHEITIINVREGFEF